MSCSNLLLHRATIGRKLNANTRDSREVCGHQIGFLIAWLICLVSSCITGGDRGKEALTFLFSTTQDRGFSITNYQSFVTGIRKAFLNPAVEIIGLAKILSCVEV